MKSKMKFLIFYMLLVVASALNLWLTLTWGINSNWYFAAFFIIISLFVIALVILFLPLIYKQNAFSLSLRGTLVNWCGKLIVHTAKRILGDNITSKYFISQVKPYDFNSWTAPEGYENKLVELSESKAYMLSKSGSTHDKVVYHMHGGAYILKYSNNYNDTAIRYSNAYDGADVFSLDYRTAPTNLYPNALEDAFEGYMWLLNNGFKPENIILTGDSAGGGLSLALTLKLRDKKLELPKMLILSSPWADLSAEGESYRTKAKADALFGTPNAHKAPKYPIPVLYAGDNDLHNPYISPAYGDYEGMPPMLIQTGSEEILLSDSKTVAVKAKKSGVDVKFIEYKGMYHIFYILTPGFPEGKIAWKEIRDFIKLHLT